MSRNSCRCARASTVRHISTGVTARARVKIGPVNFTVQIINTLHIRNGVMLVYILHMGRHNICCGPAEFQKSTFTKRNDNYWKKCRNFWAFVFFFSRNSSISHTHFSYHMAMSLTFQFLYSTHNIRHSSYVSHRCVIFLFLLIIQNIY